MATENAKLFIRTLFETQKIALMALDLPAHSPIRQPYVHLIERKLPILGFCAPKRSEYLPIPLILHLFELRLELEKLRLGTGAIDAAFDEGVERMEWHVKHGTDFVLEDLEALTEFKQSDIWQTEVKSWSLMDTLLEKVLRCLARTAEKDYDVSSLRMIMLDWVLIEVDTEGGTWVTWVIW